MRNIRCEKESPAFERTELKGAKTNKTNKGLDDSPESGTSSLEWLRFDDTLYCRLLSFRVPVPGS